MQSEDKAMHLQVHGFEFDRKAQPCIDACTSPVSKGEETGKVWHLHSSICIFRAVASPSQLGQSKFFSLMHVYISTVLLCRVVAFSTILHSFGTSST